MEYQDALAILGVGSAHPGGVDSTLTWTHHVPWTSSMSVLDVGCGTGRTLMHIQQLSKCDAHGVDIRPKMIKKAKQRAALLGLPAHFHVANAEQLPFSHEQFDVVVTESVNVFVHVEKALSEYIRVLKPGGWYVDVEMLALGPVSDGWKKSAQEVYGAKIVPDQSGWKRKYADAGFTDIQVVSTRAVNPSEMLSQEQQYPDDVNLADKDAFTNPQVIQILQSNSSWFDQHHRSLGYGIFIMRKPTWFGEA